MAAKNGSRIVQGWPEESKEAAQLVLDQYGEPDEATESQLIWDHPGPWKRIVATKAFHRHDFPMPHTDSVESFIDYRVPVEKFGPIARFDGSVVTERTSGEASARCHDEQANMLALNLMHDIVTGAKSPEEARAYYAKEVLDWRRKDPTPYMERLRFTPQGPEAADPDVRIIPEEELKAAIEEGKSRARPAEETGAHA